MKPRLRAAAQISRQYYRGERWYVVRDPAGNQYHRLSDAAYKFVGLLDGSRTVSEAWELVGGQLADDAPTQPEVIQILSQLYSANLIETNISPDATVLLRRHKKQMMQKAKMRLMNVLFPRIPLLDPDWILKLWMPVVGKLISPIGGLVWLALIIWATVAVAPHWDGLRKAGAETINFTANPANALLLYVVFAVLKAIHEFGHGFMCRRFGGEVHEMGIMFLVLFPAPYVDASSAWGFPNKWHRILVGAGGMIFELAVAAVAALIWVQVYQGGNQFVTQLCYNVMFVAGVSTVIFNINPLLRYDGYYMLSDWLEIPNLQHRSREYTLSLFKRYLFRVKWSQPLPTGSQRPWMVAYFLTSGPYRVFVGLAIMVMLLWQLPEQLKILGLILGLGSVATFFLVPLYKSFKYLSLDPELHRKRTLAWGWSLAFLCLVGTLVGLIRFPVNIRSDAVLEAQDRAYVYPTSKGQVVELLVKDNDKVEAGQPILRAVNEELDAEVKQLEARVAQAEGRIRANRVGDVPESRADELDLARWQRELADANRRKGELTVRAPIAGTLVAPMLHTLEGQWVGPGREEPLAQVLRDDTLIAYAVVDQKDYQRLTEALNKEWGEAKTTKTLANAAAPAAVDEPSTRPALPFETQLRLAGDVRQVLVPVSTRVAPAARREVRSTALTQAAGGSQVADPSDRSGKKLATPQFELEAVVTNPDRRYLPGQRGYVRVQLNDGEPLAVQGWRKLWQLVQTTRTS